MKAATQLSRILPVAYGSSFSTSTGAMESRVMTALLADEQVPEAGPSRRFVRKHCQAECEQPLLVLVDPFFNRPAIWAFVAPEPLPHVTRASLQQDRLRLLAPESRRH